MSRYKLRNFGEGDEEKIVELFNDVYGRLGGYVPRTIEYWRWCCLMRPDVRSDGVFLVFDEESRDLEGYVVVGSSGNIWEFCSRPDREDVASILLERAIGYLERMGVSAVNVNVPEGDRVLNEACRKMGFAKVNVHRMFVGVLSFSRLISLLIQDRMALLRGRFNERISIVVKDAPFWVETAISISINNGRVDVSEGSLESSTILAQTDTKTLLSTLFGILSPRRALLTFRMGVKPFLKIPKMMDFLYSIRSDDSWFWPLGDFG